MLFVLLSDVDSLQASGGGRESDPSQCLRAGKEGNSSRGLRGAVGSKAAL